MALVTGAGVGNFRVKQQQVSVGYNNIWLLLLAAAFAQDNGGLYTATGEPLLQALWRTCITDCKVYPIRRLDANDIDRGNELFKGILGRDLDERDLGRILTKGFEKLRSSPMWSRNQRNWALFTSDDGLFVVARSHVMSGDIIVIAEGGKVPFVLRPRGRHGSHDDCFEFVSASYVHGYMDRNLYGRDAEENMGRREFFIV